MGSRARERQAACGQDPAFKRATQTQFERPNSEGIMKVRKTPVASAVALVLMSAAFQSYAQQAAQPPAASNPQTIEGVTVTGVRGSLQQSLARKRDADSVTEVITAEDIGKLPDKNVADALSRVPGVTTSSAAGGEGGFDE